MGDQIMGLGASRFADARAIQQWAYSGADTNCRSIFSGVDVDARMNALRPWISEIRKHWSEYDRFMDELASAIEVQISEGGLSGETRYLVDQLLQCVKTWEPAEDAGSYSYSAVGFYTSKDGYDVVFSVFNEAFRRVGRDSLTALRPFVFLLELLNIDLYRLRESVAAADCFDGTVYRGLYLDRQHVSSLYELMKGEVQSRYVSVPLGLWSASSDVRVAIDFALNRAPNGAQAVIWRVRVENLDESLLAAYRQRFPQSVLTSLCAVPIDAISVMPWEREVILRGAFFQVIAVGEEQFPTLEGSAVVVDAVMWNSNRDHLTAIADDVGEDALARRWFRTIVSLDRARWCAEHVTDAQSRAAYASWAGKLLGEWSELAGLSR